MRLRKIEWGVLSFLIFVALTARLLPGHRLVDDSYITFRYARNIVNGNGFVYNEGERVLGTTTPLYTLLLAAISILKGTSDFPILAIGTNALAGAISVILLYFLTRLLIGHWLPATGAALVWAVAPYSVTFAIGGMETDVTIALLLAAALAYVYRRPYLLTGASALAVLARPDTGILLLLLWVGLVLSEQRIPWREGLLGLALLAPWLIYSTLTFGSPLPASIGAKSLTYRVPPTAALIRFIQHYSTPFFGDALFGAFWRLGGFVTYLALSSIGALRAVRRSPRVWPVFAYPYAYFAIFALANPLLFRWYLSPPLPFYFLTIFAGIWFLALDLGEVLSDVDAKTVAQGATAICAVVALLLTLNAWELHPDHGPDRPAPEMAWFKLELFYKQAAEIVLEQAGPDDGLCAGDIGMLGYRTGLRVIDTVGLVTPASTQFYPADPAIYVTNYAIPADLVLSLDPDFIVILEVYGRLGLLPDPRFQAQYELVERLDADIYGSRGMLIFSRAESE